MTRTPADQHARITYALHQARFDMHKRRGEVVPKDVYHALMAALGIPGIPHGGYRDAIGFAGTMERHVPDLQGTCTGCAGQVSGPVWPCNEVKTVQRVLAQLGWAT